MDVDMFFTEPDRCNHLSTPSIPQFTISCVLMAWVLVSYIPQYARIVSRKSAEGLSTLYILLGSLSGVCAVGNIMMLPSSEVEIGCCRELQRFACISGLLGMFQVIFGIACFWGVLFMYVYYSEEEAEAEIHHRRASLSGPERTFRRAKKAYLVLLCACAFAFAVMLVSAVISHRFPWYSQAWADTLGVAVAVLACVQWVPQTLTTWHLGHLGSLSLASLCLSAPVRFFRLAAYTLVHLDLRHQHGRPRGPAGLERVGRLHPRRHDAARPHRHGHLVQGGGRDAAARAAEAQHHRHALRRLERLPPVRRLVQRRTRRAPPAAGLAHAPRFSRQ